MPEALGDGQTKWRGKVQHVPSSGTRYFRDWPTLAAFLLKMLSKLNGEEGSTKRESAPVSQNGRRL